jgi:hypothetical protein
MISAMKHAALALVLAACSASSNDFPPLAEGGGPPPGISSSGGSGTVRDAGTGDGGASGGLIQGRVCIVRDLSNPTVCDTTKDASVVKVTLGTRTPAVGPDHDGLFMIAAPVGRPVWRATATGNLFVPSVMPWTTDPTIPIVPELLFNDAKGMSGVAPIAAGQGSVVVRVVNGVSPVPAATNLTSNGLTAVPLYATSDGLAWTLTGPTLASGAVWFPGVDVTSVPGKTITLTPQGGAQVITPVDVVEDQAITFVTQDLR